MYVCMCVVIDAPSAPRNVQAKERSRDYVDIIWNPPDTDGGSEIRQYIIEKSDVTRGIGPWMACGTVSATECSFRASKLFQGNAYLFRVSAENRVGAGPPGEMQGPVIAELPFGTFYARCLCCLTKSCRVRMIHRKYQ